VWSCGRGEHEQPKKEERDENEKQHEEQLEEVSLLYTSPCKPMMVVEVCCHQHELSIAVKACCLHQDFWGFNLFVLIFSFFPFFLSFYAFLKFWFYIYRFIFYFL
jgi:hypothetical protein